MSAQVRERGGGTAERILDVAEELVQTRGFNAFSYADVAAQLGVTKAALHYHFPGKAELGEAVVGRYATRFRAALESIAAQPTAAPEKLRAYVHLYAAVLAEQRMCLCGMLAAEYGTLPEAIRVALRAFFDANEAWLATILDEGRTEGTLAFVGSAPETARLTRRRPGGGDADRSPVRRPRALGHHRHPAARRPRCGARNGLGRPARR